MIGFSADYKDLEKWLKISLTGMLVITPIFYFDLFLFKKEFINANPIYINIIASYVLTLSFMIQNTITGWLILIKESASSENSFTYGIILSLMILLPVTFFSWYCHWEFKKFLYAVFVTPFAFWIVAYIVGVVKAGREKLK